MLSTKSIHCVPRYLSMHINFITSKAAAISVLTDDDGQVAIQAKNGLTTSLRMSYIYVTLPLKSSGLLLAICVKIFFRHCNQCCWILP